jgi:hypothetical protein
MAKQILEGTMPLFFYGQYYLGPLEALGIAFFFKLFGIKMSTLYLGTIFYSAVFMVSAYLLGKELKDGAVGLLMMLFCAFPSQYFFYASISPLGYFIEILFLGNFILLLTLRAPTECPGTRKVFYYLLLGACSGLGIWTHYIIFYYLVPSFIYLAVNEKWKYLFKYSIPALAAFLVAAFPFWMFTFKYHFISFCFPRSGASNMNFGYLKELLDCIMYMFSFSADVSGGFIVWKVAVMVVCISAAAYYIVRSITSKGFIFNKSSIVVYFFCFLVFLYVKYKSSRDCGLGYNYILPILTFASIVFAYLCSSLFKKSKITGFAVCGCVLCFNIADIGSYISRSKSESTANKEEVLARVKYFEDNNFYRIIGLEWDYRVPIFFSNEKIIAMGYTETHYNKYMDIVEAADSVVLENPGKELYDTLNNICASYDKKDNYYYNFKPHPYLTSVIEPARWKAVTSSNSRLAHYAFDRNDDLFWINDCDTDEKIFYEVDLGESRKICKIVLNDFTNDFSLSLQIQISSDGFNWIEAARIGFVQPLFWSGPRPYWHLKDGRVEYYFKPTDARFVRLLKDNKGGSRWEINEIYIYEYLKEKQFSRKEYVKDAVSIFHFLKNCNIDFVYADFWMSAKIREISKGSIQALVPFNPFLPYRKYSYKDVELGMNKAFVVKKEDGTSLESIFNEFGLRFKKVQFINFTAYYFPNLDNNLIGLPSLKWGGIGLMKHSLGKCGKWYFDLAIMKEKKLGEGAFPYFKKAIRYFCGDITVYSRAMNYYKQFGFRADYYKIKTIISKKMTPRQNNNVFFSNGVDFIGWSFLKNNIAGRNSYKIDYYWRINKKIKNDLYVFVYFIKDGKITFQNDHRFLEKYIQSGIELNSGTWKESLRVKIPSIVDAGEYTVKIGLWCPDRDKKRVRIKGTKSTSYEIGKIYYKK